ncbi:PREDICTED: meiosis-specific with OB domain-containing protein isoform X2 [Vollenhovia emeryi]|uniref:meiosis-specific with OB domain-containing protein isoform X2 n=1 Tax=Vollenhovia emeryi TaxID=411798 RepID=UPI0005F42A68|nr:PREDICTED: meiosis-specific with OB domain-containing protein isoform X2 [Vollenhovia emeryi]
MHSNRRTTLLWNKQNLSIFNTILKNRRGTYTHKAVDFIGSVRRCEIVPNVKMGVKTRQNSLLKRYQVKRRRGRSQVSPFRNAGERSVWTFTLRDSEEDFINVTVWGSTEFMKKLSTTFNIGSVVEVINAKIVKRNDEQFMPSTSSPFVLIVNEGAALVQKHDAPTSEQYKALLTRPVKSVTSAKSLKAILDNIEALCNRFVDLLVVVTFIADTRNIITRDGRAITCRNFEVADASTDNTVSLMLWDKDWIERAAFWEPKKTVLFLIDARIAYDEYKKKTTLSIARRTLITECLDIPQAVDITNAVQHYDPDSVCSDPFAVPNPDTITTVMTVQQISERLQKKTTTEDERLQFATIVRASITEMNLDSPVKDIISIKCALCKKIVADTQDSCMNLSCPSGNGMRTPLNTVKFNVKINLKDDTGYLIGCRLTGDIAERVLGCTVDEFQAMTAEKRNELKWLYLLEKCDVRLHILGPTSAFPRPLYNVLAIQRDKETERAIEQIAATPVY